MYLYFFHILFQKPSLGIILSQRLSTLFFSSDSITLEKTQSNLLENGLCYKKCPHFLLQKRYTKNKPRFLLLSCLLHHLSSFLLVIGRHSVMFLSLSLKIGSIIYSTISGADIFFPFFNIKYFVSIFGIASLAIFSVYLSVKRLKIN